MGGGASRVAGGRAGTVCAECALTVQTTLLDSPCGCTLALARTESGHGWSRIVTVQSPGSRAAVSAQAGSGGPQPGPQLPGAGVHPAEVLTRSVWVWCGL